MNHWEQIKDVIEIVLQALTIFVLWVTLRAVKRQADAAETLTAATNKQIETGRMSTKFPVNRLRNLIAIISNVPD